MVDVVKMSLLLSTRASSDELHTDDGAEMMQQLKDKFSLTKSRSERLRILTVLPKSWSIAKLMEEFSVTNYMARCAKKLVEEKGILSSPNSKPGMPLAESTAQLVKTFSTMMT